MSKIIAEPKKGGDTLETSPQTIKIINEAVKDWRATFDAIADLVSVQDRDYKFLKVNKSLADFCGLKPQELVGKNCYEVIHDFKKPVPSCPHEKMLKTGKTVTQEIYEPKYDSHFLVTDSPIKNEESEIIGGVHIIKDITEHKKAEESRTKIIAEHEKFLNVLEQLDSALHCSSDIETVLQKTLDLALEVFACDRVYLLYPADPDASFYHIEIERTRPEYPGAGLTGEPIPMDPLTRNYIQRWLQDGRPVVMGTPENPVPPAYREKFGVLSQLSSMVQPRVGKSWILGLQQCSDERQWQPDEINLFTEFLRRIGDGLGILLLLRDLQRNEQILSQQQYYLEKAQEIGLIGTWELDIVTNGLIWTEQNYKNFGVPSGTKMNYELFLDCVHPDDREYVNTEWMLALEGEPYDINHRIIADGKTRWVREKAEVEFDKEGNPDRAIGFTQNITEQKKFEEAVDKRTYDLGERVKELKCLYGTAQLITDPDKTLADVFKGTVNLISLGWQYPEITCARITFDGKKVVTANWKDSKWVLSADITTKKSKVGVIEVAYLEQKPTIDEGPFLKEERNLIDGLARILGDFVERKQAEEKLHEKIKELENTKKDLEKKIEELEKWQKLTVGREVRMYELKKEIEKFKEKTQ